MTFNSRKRWDYLNLKAPQWRTLQMVAVAVLLGVLVMLSGNLLTPRPRPDSGVAQKEPSTGGPAARSGDVSAQLLAEAQLLARDLEGVLEAVDGAGKVRVAITLESGSALEMAQDNNVSTRTTEERDNAGGTRVTTERTEDNKLVILRAAGGGQGDEPVVTRLLQPRIAGVLVVAEGARDPRVKERLSRAVQIALNIPAYRVEVLPGRGGE